MLLTADRLDVVAGERLRAVLVVSPPMAAVLTMGGLPRLRSELEDIAFRSAQLFFDRPASWRFGGDVTRPDVPEWLLFADLVPTQTASLRRELTGEVRVADAWDARLDGDVAPEPFHPYAASPCATARFGGAVRAYAAAYPMEAF